MAHIKIPQEFPERSESDWDWTLHLQKVTYFYDDGSKDENSYRFIWRRPNGSLQAARGQARIPSFKEMIDLIQGASDAGMFDAEETSQCYAFLHPREHDPLN